MKKRNYVFERNSMSELNSTVQYNQLLIVTALRSWVIPLIQYSFATILFSTLLINWIVVLSWDNPAASHISV